MRSYAARPMPTTSSTVSSLRRPPLAVHDEDEELAILGGHLRVLAQLRAAAGAGAPLDVLEAGCGRKWRLDTSDFEIRLVGIDLDGDALRLRQDREGDLDVALVGDLRSLDLPDASFDAIYSSFVLEHIDGAEAVLDAFVRLLRPGGLLLLRIPDRDSVYGWATRHTPHALHVAFRRHIIGMPGAGTAGHGPYPTHYDEVVSRVGLRAWAGSRGVDVLAEAGSSVYLDRAGRFGPALRLGVRAAAAASLGRLRAGHNNLTYVLRVPEAAHDAGDHRSTSRLPATRL